MLAPLLIAMAAASQQPLTGVARAGDGDSLTIRETRVRLFGIGAPEFDQLCQRGGSKWECGRDAADQLSKLVTGRHVFCLPVGTDQHERLLARCTAGAVDVNRTMVASGYAVAFRRYSTDYVTAEDSAKAARRGLWAGTFEMPAELRARATPRKVATPARRTPRRVARPESRYADGCLIKGNHSRRGDWIYHLPGMPYYAQTRPEAMFCSEAEARAAGYRRAIVR